MSEMASCQELSVSHQQLGLSGLILFKHLPDETPRNAMTFHRLQMWRLVSVVEIRRLH